jgi:2-polyprenyl-6-methoxyphenol hydroxylase-like FAD-dependent oxidoreductase
MSPAAVWQDGPRVLIIGAGLSGLVLAQGLAAQGIRFTVFERDTTSDYRPQGYRAKIPPDVGADIQAVLPPALWREFEDSCAETVVGETTMNAISGQPISKRSRQPGMGKLYNVDRAVFRRLLIKGLEKDIDFDRAFTHYEVGSGRVVAHFADGSNEQGTLLVGADGARSRVRRQYVPDHVTVDTECSCIYGKTFLTPEVLERLPQKWLKSLTCCMDTTPMVQNIIFGDSPVSFMTDPMRFPNKNAHGDPPEDYLYWGLSFKNRCLAPTDKELDQLLKMPADELALFVTKEWDPSIRSVLELQEPSTTLLSRIYSADPGMPPWTSTAEVTLVGDSIHLMSSAGGVGAVTAVRNAANLSKTLGSTGFSVESIASYEAAMRAYAGTNISRGFAGGKAFFNQPPFEMCKQLDS